MQRFHNWDTLKNLLSLNDDVNRIQSVFRDQFFSCQQNCCRQEERVFVNASKKTYNRTFKEKKLLKIILMVYGLLQLDTQKKLSLKMSLFNFPSLNTLLFHKLSVKWTFLLFRAIFMAIQSVSNKSLSQLTLLEF
jgi:hypothetical protein